MSTQPVGAQKPATQSTGTQSYILAKFSYYSINGLDRTRTFGARLPSNPQSRLSARQYAHVILKGTKTLRARTRTRRVVSKVRPATVPTHATITATVPVAPVNPNPTQPATLSLNAKKGPYKAFSGYLAYLAINRKFAHVKTPNHLTSGNWFGLWLGLQSDSHNAMAKLYRFTNK